MNYERLKEILFEKGIEQQEIAEIVGCSQAFISMVLRGLKTPSVPLLKRIADYIGASVDELM